MPRDLGPRLAHAALPIAGKGGSDRSYSWIPVVAPTVGGTAAQTGLSADVLKRLLALAATLMMGAFAKQSGVASSLRAVVPGSGGELAAMLMPLLDQDRDGSIIDDLTSMIDRFVKPS